MRNEIQLNKGGEITMKLIKRDYYLNKLLSVKDVPDIKVITGVRRSGKSKLMDAFIDLISADDKANIVRIKLNLKKFEKLLDADKLYDYIEQQYANDKTNYLFIDEIQLCEGFERVINSIYEEEIYDIIWNKIKEVNHQLTSYKAIKKLEIKKDEFEKTTTMKIKRYAEINKDK